MSEISGLEDVHARIGALLDVLRSMPRMERMKAVLGLAVLVLDEADPRCRSTDVALFKSALDAAMVHAAQLDALGGAPAGSA